MSAIWDAAFDGAKAVDGKWVFDGKSIGGDYMARLDECDVLEGSFIVGVCGYNSKSVELAVLDALLKYSGETLVFNKDGARREAQFPIVLLVKT